MRIQCTVEYLIDEGVWESVCKMFGINVWAVKEGRIDTDEYITFTKKQAKKLGLI